MRAFHSSLSTGSIFSRGFFCRRQKKRQEIVGMNIWGAGQQCFLFGLQPITDNKQLEKGWFSIFPEMRCTHLKPFLLTLGHYKWNKCIECCPIIWLLSLKENAMSNPCRQDLLHGSSLNITKKDWSTIINSETRNTDCSCQIHDDGNPPLNTSEIAFGVV